MQAGTPSRTAWRVALRRAAHQMVDRPLVFEDPFALAIARAAGEADSLRAPDRPHSRSMRAFLVARSRWAEDHLARAVTANMDAPLQYVLLGAGLDTFALRNPYAHVRVFEVDHPATQRWKREVLERAGIAVPHTAAFAAVDFHTDSLSEQLAAAGFDTALPAVFAWLGVVPYLTPDGFHATLAILSAQAAQATLLMDYGLPRHALPPVEQLMFDSLAARVAGAGEPFRQFFQPPEILAVMQTYGFGLLEDLNVAGINARYFAGREDRLRVLGSGAHLLAVNKPM